MENVLELAELFGGDLGARVDVTGEHEHIQEQPVAMADNEEFHNNRTSQSITRSRVRRRNVNSAGVGYIVSAANSISYSPEAWTNIQKIASIIAALNITTLDALEDGWHGEPQIISRCYDKYRNFLSENEIELKDGITEAGGVHFRSRVWEYIRNMDREQIIASLIDTRTSDFYPQLVDIQLRRYRGAQAHSALVLRADIMDIPKEFDYCTTYQNYAAQVLSLEQEKRIHLKNTLDRARMLVSVTKVAARDGSLESGVLEVLKRKLVALQENYKDAYEAVTGERSELLDQNCDELWNPGIIQSTSDNSSSTAVARAYEANSRGWISTLTFIVPVTCIISCIPIAAAWNRSPPKLGTREDANFFQLIAGSIIQLLSLATLLWPTISNSALAGHPWFWTRVLALVSAICALLSVPVYVLAPVCWSMAVSFGAMIAQVLIILQVVQGI